MQKTITYLYPDLKRSSSLKVYQDRNNQVKAFKFSIEDIEAVRDLDCDLSKAVYILFKAQDMQEVFVGKSLTGVAEIGKDLSGNCVMFVNDSNSWDSVSLDYLEHRIKSKIKAGSCKLINTAISVVEPKVNMYDKPTLETYIEQIEVLLMAEGIYISETKVGKKEDTGEIKSVMVEGVVDEDIIYGENEEVENGKSTDTLTYYYPKDKEYEASIYIHKDTIYLTKGSVLRLPNKDMKSRKSYDKLKKVIDGLILDKKAMYVNGKIKAVVDIKFLALTSVTAVIIGKLASGYNFFEGLRETEQPGNKKSKPTIKEFYCTKDKDFNAKIKLKGDKFVLIKGSEIRRPEEKTADYSTSYFYESNNRIIDKLIKNGSVVPNGRKFLVSKDLDFKSPSGISALVLGKSCNGWDFFDGLREIKATMKN